MASTDTRIDLRGTTRDALVAAAGDRLGHGSARRLAAAVHRQVMRERTFAPEELDADPADAAAWREHFVLPRAELAERVAEPHADGVAAVEKLVLRTPDGLEHECVHLPMGRGRHSLCISSQVGCAMGCTFCETARLGKLRDLSAGEIVGQVLATADAGLARPDTIVFQGMGEPLDNADALVDALAVLTDSNGLAYARGSLTVCTAGHVPGIDRLAALGWKRLNLSLSLNAADDATRRRLMPIARRWSLDALQTALIRFRARANLQLGIHWCLLPGINDTRDDAARIAAFCAPLGRVLVHLIPYNPGHEPVTRPPHRDEIDRFVGWLREHDLPVRRRITKGRSVMAACGQLGNAELRPARRETT